MKYAECENLRFFQRPVDHSWMAHRTFANNNYHKKLRRTEYTYRHNYECERDQFNLGLVLEVNGSIILVSTEPVASIHALEDSVKEHGLGGYIVGILDGVSGDAEHDRELTV
jgi:hypothetical protein